MTKEKAIKLLKEYRNCLFGILAEPIDMAIEALEQEPSGDAISRQAVLDLIEHYNSDGLGAVFYGYEEGVKFANAVNKLPSVKQEPKVGHWIVDKGSLDALYGEVCNCSECGIESIGERHYCPYCGAKMVEPQESEDKK